MHLQQKHSNTTYSGGVQFFSYKQMLAREREQIKENILVTNEDERGGLYQQVLVFNKLFYED
jgi:hypothetical protein